MKKEDLKLGNIIETKDGKVYLYNSTDVDFIDLDGVGALHLKQYDNDLNNTEYPEATIVKVYEDYTLKTLLWERPEPKPELSIQERNILIHALSKGFRWIVRDENDDVWLLDIKPHKARGCVLGGYWSNGLNGTGCPLTLCKDLFTFVRWEDKKPTKIKDLLIEEE